MKKILSMLAASCALASGGTLFLGAYPDSVIVFDEAKGQITDRIHLDTGLPTSLRLSVDRKKIYVTTIDHSGLEVIDVATHKVLNHFVLSTETRRFRLGGGTADPADKLYYTVTLEMNKLADRYEIGKPKYTVIDLAQQKIVKTVDIPTQDENANMGLGGGGRGSGFDVSPDGKYLYQFRDIVLVMDSSDFKVVDRIELSKPELPAMEAIGFGGSLDSVSDPRRRMSLFNSADPIVHNKVFGIANFDLSTRKFDFTPVGPAPAGMAGLHVAPDKKTAFTVVANGTLGNKRCEFWSFDLGTAKMTRSVEFPCRSRFSFGMSADGKKLYTYGAGFEIDVYDAATFKHEKTWDLANDITGGGMIVLP
jgi:DNA-binding beta-propeller fold protein YncE